MTSLRISHSVLCYHRCVTRINIAIKVIINTVAILLWKKKRVHIIIIRPIIYSIVSGSNKYS